jgi:hypothetical protein
MKSRAHRLSGHACDGYHTIHAIMSAAAQNPEGAWMRVNSPLDTTAAESAPRFALARVSIGDIWRLRCGAIEAQGSDQSGEMA